MRSLHDLDVAGKRAFVRADFNVPLEHGRVSDATRIDATLPTLRWLLDHGAKLVLASHLGRPKGKRTAELSLRPVADVLSSRLGRPVTLAPDCIGAETEALVAKMNRGDVLLLENLRFHPEEERNEPGFAAQLARLADVYVDDAFGAAHRAHASTAGMVPLVHERAAGLLLAREVEMLSRLMRAPEKPFVAVLGGAKVSDKIGVIEHLLTRVTSFVIGGAMAYTFLRAQGKPVGRSRVEDDKVELARETLTRATQAGVAVLLPLDHLVADKPEAGAATRVVPAADFPPDMLGVDIGPETAKRYAAEIAAAKTVLWNGPMGIFEVPAFAAGTMGVAKVLAPLKAMGAVTVVGGGDSVAAVQQSGLAERFSHLSTGGGASLEFLEGKVLPGVAALDGASG